jgi:hypothetical protein
MTVGRAKAARHDIQGAAEAAVKGNVSRHTIDPKIRKMKRLLKVVGLTGLVFMSVLATRAQGGPPPDTKRKFNHRAQIVSAYDKAKDQTSVVMLWYRVSEDAKEPALFSQTRPPAVSIMAGFGYPGRVLRSTPPSIEFHIEAEYEGKSLFKVKEMPDLIAVVDGESISLGKLLLERSKTTVGILAPRQITVERLVATFTYQGLLRLTGGKKVTMKAGRLEFELKDRHLEALRDLASRMVP